MLRRGKLIATVDLATLDPETRRLADHGAKEIIRASLDAMVEAMHLAGEEFDQKDLHTLVLAGRMAEEIDRKDALSSK